MTLDLFELNLTSGLYGVSLLALIRPQRFTIRPICKPWVSVVYVGSLFIGAPGGNRSRDRIDLLYTITALMDIVSYFLVTQMIFRLPMGVLEQLANSIVSERKSVTHAVDSVPFQTVRHYSAHTTVSVEARKYNQGGAIERN